MKTALVARFKIDPGLLAVFLLATLAAWPLLTRVSLPALTDAEMHAYRTQEILEAWRGGVLYTRWAPDFFYAFGYPVFNYYSPLTYYLGAAYGWVFCGGALVASGAAVAGVKFVLVASAYLGAVGMYLLAREYWGGLPGVVAAAAFSFSPYVLFIDPHARGDSPETFAIALAPLVFWAFRRVRQTAAPGWRALAAVLLAAEVLSHNLMALVFFGLLLAWLAWELVFSREAITRGQALKILGAAVALGLGLAAFMWLPAILERNAVQYKNVAGGTGIYFDLRHSFSPAFILFGPNAVFDFGATQAAFRYNLGVAQWILAALGVAALLFRRPRWPTALFFALAGGGLIFFILPVSLKIWDAIPPLAFMQFPTRLLGPTAVALAMLAGAATDWAQSWRGRALGGGFAAAAIAACVGLALPLLYPPLWPEFSPLSARAILQAELNGRALGTTSGNDFLPVGVKQIPAAPGPLIDSYAGGLVDKVNRAALPSGAQVRVNEHGPLHDRFATTALEDFTLTLYTFYFPGWTVYIDGARVPLEVTDPEGWIKFRVPAGEHTVLAQLEETPPRQLAWALSALALAGVVILGVVQFFRARSGTTVESPMTALPLSLALGLSAVILAGMGARAWADRTGWGWVHSTGNEALVAQYPQLTQLENHIALLGYDLPLTSARPGERVYLTLYWKAQAPVPLSLRVYAHLFSPDGQLRGQSDKWHPADFPTVGWPLDRYVRDPHIAELQPDAPPGEYTVRVGLWNPNTGQRMRMLDENGQFTEVDSVTLATPFTVRP